MNETKNYEYPEAKQVVVCGDIHGKFDELVYRITTMHGMTDTVVVVAGDCGFGFHRRGYYDAGAAERYSRDAHPKIVAQKKRDVATGCILSLELQDGADEVVSSVTAKYPQAQFLVVDDLCDGGGTFVRLAQLLGARYPDHQRRIFVTHMVNAQGISALADNYHQVTFTNSFRDWRHADGLTLPDNVSVVDIDREW